MVYIIILNWKNASDTIECLKSVIRLENVQFRIVICDNASPDNSYEEIKSWLLRRIEEDIALTNVFIIELANGSRHVTGRGEKKNPIYLIQTGKNLGYAGGNNVGIRFALDQSDMKYVWLLNNDTEVAPDSLFHLVERCQSNSKIGICGSKLVYYDDRTKLQGLGGIYHPLFCRVTIHAENENSANQFNDDTTEEMIDYVIGASMLITKSLLTETGLLNEEYFLYFEELDIAFRAKSRFRISSASKSIVYHKEGASIGKSLLSDYYSLKNRITFTKKNNKLYFPTVWLGLIGSTLNRIKRKEFRKALNIIKIMLFITPKEFKQN